MISIMKLLFIGISQGKIGTLDLILLLIILIILAVVFYKNNKYFKLFYNSVINLIPIVKRQYIIFANFSKQSGTIGPIINKYMEVGCKKYIVNKNKFNDSQTVDENYLKETVKKQQDIIAKAKERIKSADSFIYIGFPHIPLGFLDGINFTDTDAPILYEHQYADTEHRKKGFFELEKVYNTNLSLITNIDKVDIHNKQIALKIEQSFLIDNNGIEQILGNIPIIYLRAQSIKRSGISNYSQIDIYKKEFEKMLCELKNKGVQTIHLFATTPASLSFSLGSVIKHYHPEVIVYNFNNGLYDWAVNLNTKKIITPSLIEKNIRMPIEL